jgi:hypothetical protein
LVVNPASTALLRYITRALKQYCVQTLTIDLSFFTAKNIETSHELSMNNEKPITASSRMNCVASPPSMTDGAAPKIPRTITVVAETAATAIRIFTKIVLYRIVPPPRR